MRAIQISEFGGPDVLALVDLPCPAPAAEEVLIEITRVGVNFADTHSRSGTYVRQPALPFVPGIEVAGIDTVTGERVVALIASGGYAEYATAQASLTFPIPDGLDDDTAVALLVQGSTAWHLYRTAARVSPGADESVVIHSAAGGVGSLAVQLGRALGAGRLIATASSPERRELALALGADVAVDPAPDGLTERLLRANGDRPVDVVFDMSGGQVFDQSYAALGHFGRIVVCGISGGEANVVRSGSLLRHSRAVVGFYLAHVVGRPQMLREGLDDLFARALAGELRVVVGEVYPLAQAQRAHRDLSSRRTSGKLLLDPRA